MNFQESPWLTQNCDLKLRMGVSIKNHARTISPHRQLLSFIKKYVQIENTSTKNE